MTYDAIEDECKAIVWVVAEVKTCKTIVAWYITLVKMNVKP